MSFVVAVAQRKGGAGKTTLAATLAATSVSRAFHTGTVDLDSQANLSRWALGREVVDGLFPLRSVAALEWPIRTETVEFGSPLLEAKSEAELLEIVLPECVHESPKVPGLKVVPCAPHIHPEEARSLVLQSLPFDVAIVDTPPDVSGWAVRSVLRQADAVVAPVVCDPWAIDGVEHLLREIVSVGRGDLLDRGLVRLVLNMKQKTALADRMENEIRRLWGDLICPVVIPRSVAIAEASLAAEVLTKKHALWKAGLGIWADLDNTLTKREAA
jgi:cellulose biosynthesis protein BcsQ